MKNTKAMILQLIGIILIILGMSVSLIAGISMKNYLVSVGGAASSFIVGMMFVGFAEIINILHINTENQQKLYNAIKELQNK